jgi:hypothetical protein
MKNKAASSLNHAILIGRIGQGFVGPAIVSHPMIGSIGVGKS